jgi:putative endonuclease
MSGFVRRWLGNRGEKAAAKFLRRKGLRILARQFETRWGELDLIARDGDTLVFVEVKTRRSGGTTHPTEAVDRRKQTHLTKAALVWLKKNGLLGHRTRFDVVALIWSDDSRQPDIEHFVSAFDAADVGQMF